MKYKTIKAANYILAISDNNIEAGDVFIDDYGLIREAVTNDTERADYKKVIAYLPLSNAERLEGLPLLPDIDIAVELKDFESTKAIDVLNMGNVEHHSNGDVIYNPNLFFIKRNDKWFIKTYVIPKYFIAEIELMTRDIGDCIGVDGEPNGVPLQEYINKNTTNSQGYTVLVGKYEY